MKFWFWATVVFVVGFGVAAWLMHVYTNAELANYIALVAAGVACAQSARQANAAANETLIDRGFRWALNRRRCHRLAPPWSIEDCCATVGFS